MGCGRGRGEHSPGGSAMCPSRGCAVTWKLSTNVSSNIRARAVFARNLAARLNWRRGGEVRRCATEHAVGEEWSAHHLQAVSQFIVP